MISSTQFLPAALQAATASIVLTAILWEEKGGFYPEKLAMWAGADPKRKLEEITKKGLDTSLIYLLWMTNMDLKTADHWAKQIIDLIKI